jgi:hypothetical protein
VLAMFPPPRLLSPRRVEGCMPPPSHPLVLSPPSPLIPSPHRSRFKLVVVAVGDAPLSAAELINLLSTPNLALISPFDSRTSSKYSATTEHSKSLAGKISPLKSSLQLKFTMDEAASFGNSERSSPCKRACHQSGRVPLSPMKHNESYEVKNVKSPFRPFQSRSILID